MPQAGGDGISSVTWSPTSNILISTNWDGGVRCWEVQEQVGQIHAVPKAQGKNGYGMNAFIISRKVIICFDTALFYVVSISDCCHEKFYLCSSCFGF